MTEEMIDKKRLHFHHYMKQHLEIYITPACWDAVEDFFWNYVKELEEEIKWYRVGEGKEFLQQGSNMKDRLGVITNEGESLFNKALNTSRTIIAVEVLLHHNMYEEADKLEKITEGCTCHLCSTENKAI